ncbi:MAG: hypothetical protein RIC52_14905 [Amphiplicatus sp.]
MCASRKQVLTVFASIAATLLTLGSASAEPAGGRSAGGAALGESQGGVTDRAYISAPPNYLYIVEKEPGSFLDCGEGMGERLTDQAGRDLAGLSCGVTLTETMIIPAAAESARIIIHY